MGSKTPTPMAEKRAAFTLAVVSKAAPAAVKWAAYTNVRKTGSIYPGRSVQGGTNSSRIGSKTSTPIALWKEVYVTSIRREAGSVITAVPIT